MRRNFPLFWAALFLFVITSVLALVFRLLSKRELWIAAALVDIPLGVLLLVSCVLCALNSSSGGDEPTEAPEAMDELASSVGFVAMDLFTGSDSPARSSDEATRNAIDGASAGRCVRASGCDEMHPGGLVEGQGGSDAQGLCRECLQVDGTNAGEALCAPIQQNAVDAFGSSITIHSI